MAACLARLDVQAAWAVWAAENKAVRPVISDGPDFIIQGGRHPVVEDALRKSGAPAFTSNDCALSSAAKEQPRLTLITGPNMAGKSTYLRQNALMFILAQSGGYVPADTAEIGVADQLFSRVGASDDLSKGRSTFMTEMIETAAILNQATERSFVILDEIGRGTSTFDGLSIAWASVEHLLTVNKSRALFATHYHELTELIEINMARAPKKPNMMIPDRETAPTTGFSLDKLSADLDAYGQAGGPKLRADILAHLKSHLTTSKEFAKERFERGRLDGLETARVIAALHDDIVKALWTFTTKYIVVSENRNGTGVRPRSLIFDTRKIQHGLCRTTDRIHSLYVVGSWSESGTCVADGGSMFETCQRRSNDFDQPFGCPSFDGGRGFVGNPIQAISKEHHARQGPRLYL